MPKGRQPEEILFSRGSQDGESTADDWDDTELLREYDKAVRPLKALVAERMGISNAELEEASASESCTSSRSAIDKGQQNQKRNQKRRRRKGKKKQHREWAVGDHCQAMFTVDNTWYEATILSIDVDQGTCLLQYVGYGNTEEQPLHAISHSMGAAVRREQTRIASLEKDLDVEGEQTDDVSERSSHATSSMSRTKEDPSVRGIKHSAPPGMGETHSNHSRPRVWQEPRQGSCFPGIPGFAPPPAMQDVVPPPLPPHIMSGLPADDSEALSAMLMSWYMSGFHTGYYQGLKRAKNCSSPQH